MNMKKLSEDEKNLLLEGIELIFKERMTRENLVLEDVADFTVELRALKLKVEWLANEVNP